MDLGTLELENRIGCLLADRMRMAGQLNGLDDEQLAGIGKALKKVAKNVGKVVRKVAPAALAIGVAGTALNIAAKSKAKKKAKKAAALVAQTAAAPTVVTMPAVQDAAAEAMSSGAAPVASATLPAAINAAAQVANAVVASQLPAAAELPGMQQLVRDSIAAQAQQANPYQPAVYQPQAIAAQDSAATGKPTELEEFTVNGKRSWLWPALGVVAVGALVVASNRNRRARAA